jgi:hypothetical protein
MAGIAGDSFGDVDDRPGRIALSRGGGAQLGRSLVFPLEREALGALELSAGLGELLQLRR